MNIEQSKNSTTEFIKPVTSNIKAITNDMLLPKGKLLGILMDNVEHAIEPVGTLHQLVKNSINSYPSVGDLMPRLT